MSEKLLLVRDQPENPGDPTMGVLTFGDHELQTIERPWIPDPDGNLGGAPFRSCVPDGLYSLRLHTRGDGTIVPALFNADHGVYYTQAEMPDGKGRYKILIHVGNYVDDIVGCIAPGTGRAAGPMVTSSRAAMNTLMSFLEENPAYNAIDIRWSQPDES